jgi:hypothetical protein
MRKCGVLCALALLAGLPLQARADISYVYVTDQSNYNVAAGASVTVNVFLQEILTGTSTSLIAQDGGMLSAAAAVALKSGTSATITTASANAATGNPTGSTNNPSSVWGTTSFAFAVAHTATNANFGVNSNGSLGTATNINPDASGKILIGNLVITASSTATGVTTYNLVQNTGGFGNTITAGASAASQAAQSAYDLDSTNNASTGAPTGTYFGTTDTSNPNFGLQSFTITVAAVPEPSSMVLCGMLAVGGMVTVYRRRRAASTPVAEAA